MNKTNKVVYGITAYLSCLLSAATALAANWYPLPDTGVTKCYDNNGNVISCPLKGQPFYGQDAQYTSTNPSYTELGNGTIKDNNTGLVWQKSDDGVKRNWQDANDYCNNLTLAGYTWRIPSLLELHSIVDYSSKDESNYCPMNNLFDCQEYTYWSDTPAVNIDYPENLLYSSIFFNRGIYFGSSSFLEGNLVRCVNGDKKESVFSSSDNGTTVSDFTTQLVWQQADDGIQRTWTDAMPYCENLTLAGYQDWRLPNIKELNTIIDRSNNSPAVNPTFNCKSDKYISSTIVIDKLSEGICPTVKFFSFENGTSWDGSLSDLYYVRCVRGGLPNDEITVQNYRLGNVDPRSDRFSVWMDISINGQKPTPEYYGAPDPFCDNYKLFVKGDNGKGAKQIDKEGRISCLSVPNNIGQAENTQSYRVDFEIDKDGTYPTAAYFENGKIIARDNSTGAETELSGLSNFSIYGTTFDLSADAWNFENESWKITEGDSDEYRKVIANEIDTWSERNYFPLVLGKKGKNTREDFNDFVGFEGAVIDNPSNGLCYGLASSAIASFTQNNYPDTKHPYSWGTGGVKNWKIEIDNHWNKENDHAVPPYKPFDKIIYALTWDEAAKMIMYYFAAQSPLRNSYKFDNWVGKDGEASVWFSEKRADEIVVVNNILKKGRPALFFFNNHVVVLTQLLKHDNETIYLLWDNYIPYNEIDPKCPYIEWHIKDVNFGDSYDPSLRDIVRVGKVRRDVEIKYTLKDGDLPYILMPCLNNRRDSQNIYNLRNESWNEPCPEWQPTGLKFSAKAASSPSQSAGVSYNTPNHIKVMFIGGTINGIYNQATEEKISPVFSGTLQPDKASIQSTMGGTWHLLHLPAKK